MHRFARGALVISAVAAAAVPLMLAPVPAGAARVAPLVLAPQHGLLVPNSTANTSSAGYISVLGGQTSVQGTFVVPKVTCNGAQYLGMALQLEAYDGTTSESMVSAAEIACSAAGAKPTYSTYVCAGENCSYTTKVASGNTITVTDSFTSRKTTATLLDVTTGGHEKASGAGATSATNSNFLVQRADATIPRFKTVVWSNCTVNGEALADAEASGENMTNADDVTQVVAGAVEGSGFVATFKHI